ncbi:MAG: hypothetical protein TR69_WS6001000089 [candidate division WS6 bacterium OLB20]|uniref:Uncharacterized protein n=1 Tax=candidate division WS6 bacterium OLB20 TaxID=1617426 RepID=A0A136M000_9BACT|nr:MAG: hypothetical protein TR69_WS6001000089 [candidate division WS6 bacterium OLB20]
MAEKKSKDKKPAKKEISIEEELRKLNRNISQQNYYFTRSQVVIRGLINGLFTALGATIGLTIVLFMLASVLRTVSAVPFINDILQQTGINRIIEYQLREIEEQQPDSLPETGTPDATPADSPVPEGAATPTGTTVAAPTSRFELTDEY